jgi:hypothetical protein
VKRWKVRMGAAEFMVEAEGRSEAKQAALTEYVERYGNDMVPMAYAEEVREEVA